MANLKGKIIIVSGGSGLIGRNIVEKIKYDGAISINVDKSCETDYNLANISCDITNEQSVSEVIKAVVGKYGKIDGLVNTAYPRTKDWGLKFEDIPFQSWKINIDLQMNSVFMFCQQVLKQMREQGFGSIVNLSSIYGTIGPDFTVYNGTEMTMPAAYSAIKGGIVNFSRYLASYYGRNNIRINCVSPGGIFDNQPDIFVQNYKAKVPMGRMGTPDDISPAVRFLLSDEAAYITGQNLIIDGGWTCI